MVSKRDMKFPEKKGVDILEMKKQLLGTTLLCGEHWTLIHFKGILNGNSCKCYGYSYAMTSCQMIIYLICSRITSTVQSWWNNICQINITPTSSGWRYVFSGWCGENSLDLQLFWGSCKVDSSRQGLESWGMMMDGCFFWEGHDGHVHRRTIENYGHFGTVAEVMRGEASGKKESTWLLSPHEISSGMPLRNLSLNL